MKCLLCSNDWHCTAADGKKVKQKAHKKKKREIDKPAASPVTASAHPGELSSATHICTCSVTAFAMSGVLSECWSVRRLQWHLPCIISDETCIICDETCMMSCQEGCIHWCMVCCADVQLHMPSG